MSKYKKGEQCYDARSDGSMSILEAAKKAAHATAILRCI